jgi:hypothetical protein
MSGKKKWYDISWLCIGCQEAAALSNKRNLPPDLAAAAIRGGVGTKGRSWAVFTDDPEAALKQKSPNRCPHCKGTRFKMEIRAVHERKWEEYERKYK